MNTENIENQISEANRLLNKHTYTPTLTHTNTHTHTFINVSPYLILNNEIRCNNGSNKEK